MESGYRIQMQRPILVVESGTASMFVYYKTDINTISSKVISSHHRIADELLSCVDQHSPTHSFSLMGQYQSGSQNPVLK